MRTCSLAAISTESARSNAWVLAANFIGAGLNPGTGVSRKELRMHRSRMPGSGGFVDRARRRGLGSCQTRGAWFATVCTHPTHVFQGGSCQGEEADGASIRGHLVSSQFPWEVKFASDSPVEGDGFELVWGFSCQGVVLGSATVFCSEWERSVFVTSPWLSSAALSEGDKGPK